MDRGLMPFLRDSIRARRTLDPLAPVTVVVRSSVLGLALRRALAESSSLINVRFLVPARLAELLAGSNLVAQGLRIRSMMETTEVARLALAAAPGVLEPFTDSPSVIRHLARTLDSLSETNVEALAGTGEPLPVAVAELWREAQRRWAGTAGRSGQMDAAAEAVASTPAWRDLGWVIWVAPEASTVAERRLVEAIVEAGRGQALSPEAQREPKCRYLLAPDETEEARMIARDVLRGAESGLALHRIVVAVASERSIPVFMRIFREARILANTACGTTVAQSGPGIAALTASRLMGTRLEKRDVESLWAPSTIPEACDWIRLGRTQRLRGGFDGWRAALGDGHPSLPSLALLRSAPTRWESWSGRIVDALALLRPEDPDVRCRAVVEEALADVGRLDSLGGRIEAWAATMHLQEALASKSQNETLLGDGVHVGVLAQIAGMPVDRLYVAGMVEGAYPRPLRPDPFLGDWALTAGWTETPNQERQDFDLALASAGDVVLSASRSVRSTGQERMPAPWFLERARRDAGMPLATVEELATSPVFESVESSVAGLTSVPLLTEADRDTVELLSSHRRAQVAEAWRERGLARALALAASRRTMEPAPGDELIRVAAPERTSPSALETFFDCPQRFFLAQRLRLRELEEADPDRLTPLELGSLVHRVWKWLHLAYPRPPGAPWDATSRTAAMEQLSDGFGACMGPIDDLARRELSGIQQSFLRMMDADEALRRETGASVLHVEWSFVLEPDGDRTFRIDGRVDRIDRGPAGYHVHDYKTGSVFPYSSKDVSRKGSKLQALVYAEAVQNLLGEPTVATGYWFYRPARNPIRAIPYSDEAAQHLTEVLRIAETSWQSGHYPRRPKSCGTCPFDGICPDGRKSRWDEMSRNPALAGYVNLVEGQNQEPEDLST